MRAAPPRVIGILAAALLVAGCGTSGIAAKTPAARATRTATPSPTAGTTSSSAPTASATESCLDDGHVFSSSSAYKLASA
jgi:hypothetical protein